MIKNTIGEKHNWWETQLMRNIIDEKHNWWKTQLMKNTINEKHEKKLQIDLIIGCFVFATKQVLVQFWSQNAPEILNWSVGHLFDCYYTKQN